jgi:5'-nucleotidase
MTIKNKTIVYVDMDNVLVDFPAGITQLSAGEKKEYEGRYDDTPGIFAKMPPIEGAVKGFEALSGYFDTYILSTAPWDNPTAWIDKLNWVKKYLTENTDPVKGLAHKRLILSHNKNLNIQEGAYLIDDSHKNGAGEFGSMRLSFGLNRDGGVNEFPTWDSVLDRLGELESGFKEYRDSL